MLCASAFTASWLSPEIISTFTPIEYNDFTRSSVPSLRSSWMNVNRATGLESFSNKLAPCPCFKASSSTSNNFPDNCDFSARINATSEPLSLAYTPFSLSEISDNSNASISSSSANATIAWAYG